MKHCKSCRRCRIDKKAFETFGVVTKKCSYLDYPILYPWLQGLFCKYYDKR